MNNKKKSKIILKILNKIYPKVPIPLNYKNTFTLLVSVLLSAQCTDVNVNNVTKNIYPKYNKPSHFVKLGRKKIERLIKLKKIESNFESIDQLITSLKPPIFWKEKPILKKQIKNWKINELEKIIFKLNKIEIECKTKSDISSIIFLNFFNEICFQASSSS